MLLINGFGRDSVGKIHFANYLAAVKAALSGFADVQLTVRGLDELSQYVHAQVSLNSNLLSPLVWA